jgi:predicted RNase H-like HicB family nuclease
MCTATFIEQFEALKAENARLSERVGELEAQLDKLHGHKFSERDFTGLTSRAETAEARLSQAEGLLREWKAAFFDEGRSYPLVETHYFLHLEQEKNT